LEVDGATASMRELARAAGVSVPTLRHYFADREQVLAAVMDDALTSALPHLHHLATGPLPAFPASVLEALEFVRGGLEHSDLRKLHVLGLKAGLGNSMVGVPYLSSVLEPSLVAIETRLARHAAQGEVRSGDFRLAALELIGPLLLVVLHQQALGGCQSRPLDLDAFVEAHAASFVRAWSRAATA
jgi:AcrR family transcriptional regulator